MYIKHDTTAGAFLASPCMSMCCSLGNVNRKQSNHLVAAGHIGIQYPHLHKQALFLII
jgi:hypothetical protein